MRHKLIMNTCSEDFTSFFYRCIFTLFVFYKLQRNGTEKQVENGKGRFHGCLTEEETRSSKFFGCDYHQLERPLDSWTSLGCVDSMQQAEEQKFWTVFKLLHQSPNWKYIYICLDEFTNRPASFLLILNVLLLETRIL